MFAVNHLKLPEVHIISSLKLFGMMNGEWGGGAIKKSANVDIHGLLHFQITCCYKADRDIKQLWLISNIIHRWCCQVLVL